MAKLSGALKTAGNVAALAAAIWVGCACDPDYVPSTCVKYEDEDNDTYTYHAFTSTVNPPNEAVHGKLVANNEGTFKPRDMPEPSFWNTISFGLLDDPGLGTTQQAQAAGQGHWNDSLCTFRCKGVREQIDSYQRQANAAIAYINGQPPSPEGQAQIDRANERLAQYEAKYTEAFEACKVVAFEAVNDDNWRESLDLASDRCVCKPPTDLGVNEPTQNNPGLQFETGLPPTADLAAGMPGGQANVGGETPPAEEDVVDAAAGVGAQAMAGGTLPDKALAKGGGGGPGGPGGLKLNPGRGGGAVAGGSAFGAMSGGTAPSAESAATAGTGSLPTDSGDSKYATGGGAKPGGGDGSGGDFGSRGGVPAGGSQVQDFGSGGGAGAGDASVMASEDPMDYFTRIGIEENIFKKVEKKLDEKERGWILDEVKKP
jgi:hypothetical protein